MDLAIPPDLKDLPEGSKATQVNLVGGSSGGEEDRVEEVKKSESWVSVAQDRKMLKKHDVEVLKKDGVSTVEIPDEIVENSTSLWEDFVVGRFLDPAPHVAKVHMVLNKIWKYGDATTKVDVYEVSPTMMRFKVSNPKAREKIIRRGMWNIAGVPMIVSRLSPKVGEDEKEDESIPMWVHLEKVPLHMYSWEGFSLITSTVGFPVKLHPDTIACTNLEEAKVFVKVDTSKVLPREITFRRDGKEFTFKYYYPWLPARCKKCDKWGHGETVCGQKAKEKKKHENSGVKGSPKLSSDEKKQAEDAVGDVVKEVENESMLRPNEDEVRKGSDVEVNKEDISRVNEEWAAKVGRSPTNPSVKSTEKIEISASKYYVLRGVEEQGECLEVEQNDSDVEQNDETSEILDSDVLEDSILEQCGKGREKVGTQKGMKRGQKAKAQPAMSTRSSQRLH